MVLGFVVLLLVAVPVSRVFGRDAVYGYLIGLVAMAGYFLYLLLFVEGPQSQMTNVGRLSLWVVVALLVLLALYFAARSASLTSPAAR
jgi:hypothetical protein